VDGPSKPKKHGKNTNLNIDHLITDLRMMLDELCMPWHTAPGEIEAECVRLQKLGLVDAVWM
jgi:Holliday junction resolvase YEN1